MKYNPNRHHRRSIRLRDYDYSQAGLYFVTICCDGRQCRFGRIKNGEMIMNEYGTVAYNEWIRLTERFPWIEMDVFQIMPNHMHGIIAITQNKNHVVRTMAIRTGASPAPTVTADMVAVTADMVAVATDDNVPVGATLAVDPGVIDPGVIDPGVVDPGVIDPGVVDPGAVDPGAVDPGVVDPGVVDPDRRVTVGDIVGAYKSLVSNACLKIYKSNHKRMGKIWQRNYWEHVIRNEQEFNRIRHYIENNPIQWEYDKLNNGSGNRVLEPPTEYGEESWMV